ncbi:MAG: hypothetical protein SNJ84_02735 [Verrucomicrobiia bacterium]
MKSPLLRWLLLLVLVLALLGGGIFAFFHFFKDSPAPTIAAPAPTPKPLTSAQFLPANTFLYLRMPDAPTAISRFKASPAFALLTNPGVVQSWKNAGAKTPVNDLQTADAWKGWPQFLAFVTGMADLADGDAFIALSDLKFNNNTPSVQAIAGLQLADNDSAIGAWLEHVRALDPELQWNAVSDVPHPYYTATPKTDQPDLVLCAARLNRWVFFGIGTAHFEAVLARAAETQPQPGNLADDPLFQQTLNNLPPQPDLFTYLNFAPIASWLANIAAQTAAANPPAAETDPDAEDADPTDASSPTDPSKNLLQITEKFKALKTLAMTTTLSGSDWLDGLHLLTTPDNNFLTPPMRVPLSGATARFAASDALLASFQNVDFSTLLDQIKQGDPTLTAQVDEFTGLADAFLAEAGVALQADVLNNLGPEMATILEWAPGNPMPSVLIVIQHKKQEPLKKTLDHLAASAAALGGLLQVESSLVGQDPAYTLSSPMAPIPPLTFYLGADVLVFAFNAGAPTQIANRQGPGLLGSPDYLALRARLGPPTVNGPIQISYVDANRLYANLHGAASTWLPMIPGFAPDSLSLPTPSDAEPYLGRTLSLVGMDGDHLIGSSITEKVHPAFLLLASIGWIAELGDKLPKKQPPDPDDETFEAEVLEVESADAMAPALPADPEPIFDNVPGAPGSPAPSDLTPPGTP